MKSILTLTLAALALTATAADYVVITKNDVNLRETPSTTGTVVGKGKKGTILNIVGKENGWFKATNPQVGENPVWVSASVAQQVADYVSPTPAIDIVFQPDVEMPYQKTTTFKGGEETIVWTFSSDYPKFWDENKPGNPITATKTHSIVRSVGGMTTVDSTYKGTYQPTYLVLTEESILGGDFTPLAEPIYVYPAFPLDGTSGILINGETYDDTAGGMDDEW